MKYKLSLAAVAIALLASCTEAEIVEQSESMKITFETYIGKNNNTRGMPITNTKFAADSTLRIFGVIKDNANALDATWNNNSFTSISGMTADAGAIYKKLNGDNNNWTVETISCWVPGKYHPFFAYALAAAT